MDISGAVDLSLQVSEIDMPDTARLLSPDLERWANESAYGIPPVLWTRLQLTRLAAASVLEARLLHVKTARLGFYDLLPDPTTVTVQQLAPLQLTHLGTAGQAFEIAVADAVEAGHPEVTDLIRAGLRRLNLTAEGPLSMMVLGVEKVPGDLREVFWNEVRAVLPDDGKLRTGARGRPASIGTAISTLATITASELQRPRSSDLNQVEYRDRFSQLGRADALVACGSDLVAASLKINKSLRGAETWKDVPLWICAGPEAEVEVWQDHTVRRRSPRVTVVLPTRGWFGMFHDALAAVDAALDRINRDRPPSRLASPYAAYDDWDMQTHHFRVSDAIARTLWRLRREPIAAVTTELRRIHPGLHEAAGTFAVSRDDATLTALDVPELVAAFRTDSDDGRLFTTQQHLFRHLQPREKAMLLQ